MKSNEYDVLVIGAGPAGSVAARHCALRGYKVLLIEKRPVIGAPVRCGEATGEREKLAIYAPVNEDYIESDITGAILHATGGLSIRAKLPRTTLMLDRLQFDPWLAKCAADAGAEVVTNARAKDVRPVQNGMREVPIDFEGNEHLVKARVVIGADGVESLTGRWTGLKCRMMPPTTCSAIELKLDILDTNTDCLTFWQGHDSINNGYVWSFPKVKSGTTNFGAGFITPKLHTPNIHEIALKWKETLYPQANVIGCWGGIVPVSGVLEESVADHFLLVGDAAHQTDPMTGGGIAAGMRGGWLAARTIDEAFKAGDLSHGFLKRYNEYVWERIGKGHATQLKVREWILDMDRNAQIEFYTMLKHWAEQGQSIPKTLLTHPLLAAKTAYSYLRYK